MTEAKELSSLDRINLIRLAIEIDSFISQFRDNKLEFNASVKACDEYIKYIQDRVINIAKLNMIVDEYQLSIHIDIIPIKLIDKLHIEF